ncbi:ABC transporter permease [Listeria grayi]|nr:ABC transporter permease [Listeria grayi]
MRIAAIVKRIMNQFRRDKRTLALLFLAPLLLLTLLHFLFQSDSITPNVGIQGLSATYTKTLRDTDMTLKTISSDVSADKLIKENDYDAVIIKKGKTLTLTFQNDDPNKTKEIAQKFQQALKKSEQKQFTATTKEMTQTIKELQQVVKQLPQGPQLKQPKISKPQHLKVHTNYVYGDKDTSYFDTIAPIFIGFFVFFFVFLIAGISFLRERTTGTLERLMVTPIKRFELELGYLIGFGIFAVIQSVLVVFYAVNVLGMIANGSIWYVLLITLLLAFVSMALGMLLSTFASSEFQIIQFIPIVIVPQVLFCGIFSIEGMANWLQWLAHIMPFYYGADALQAIMIKGQGFSAIQYDIGILLLFAIGFLILNMFALKKYRKM